MYKVSDPCLSIHACHVTCNCGDTFHITLPTYQHIYIYTHACIQWDNNAPQMHYSCSCWSPAFMPVMICYHTYMYAYNYQLCSIMIFWNCLSFLYLFLFEWSLILPKQLYEVSTKCIIYVRKFTWLGLGTGNYVWCCAPPPSPIPIQPAKVLVFYPLPMYLCVWLSHPQPTPAQCIPVLVVLHSINDLHPHSPQLPHPKLTCTCCTAEH